METRLPREYTVSRGVPDYARTEIKKILTPKGENYIIYSVKSQNFDEIVFFSAGSENSSVHRRTRIFRFCRKSKISQNYDF